MFIEVYNLNLYILTLNVVTVSYRRDSWGSLVFCVFFPPPTTYYCCSLMIHLIFPPPFVSDNAHKAYKVVCVYYSKWNWPFAKTLTVDMADKLCGSHAWHLVLTQWKIHCEAKRKLKTFQALNIILWLFRVSWNHCSATVLAACDLIISSSTSYSMK